MSKRKSHAPFDWAAFDRKYVVRSPLDHAIAYQTAPTSQNFTLI